MKAISAIIGTILILMITLALVSVSYFYIFGIYTTKTLVIEGVGVPTVTKEDSTCSITWKIRNLAADTVSVTISKVSTAACTLSTTSPSNIIGGGSLDITATGCAVNNNHVFKAAGPSNTVNLIAYCA
ncbi:hypothetical protein HZB88_00250 [archaeon]|nr:hypothetical protein [archaeon]